MSDIHKTPLGDLSKCELRQLIADMRIRHSNEKSALLALLPAEVALEFVFSCADRVSPVSAP